MEPPSVGGGGDKLNQLVLFTNDNVDAGFFDGCKVQLSGCATSFVHDRPIGRYAHPLQEMSRMLQRTQFVTSEFKKKVKDVLEFRNRFAERPYLCPSLIPHDEQLTLYEDISHVCWPSCHGDDDCCIVPLDDGSLRIVSIDDHAAMTLSAHGRDFSVSFLAKLSQPSQTFQSRSSERNVLSEISCNSKKTRRPKKQPLKESDSHSYWLYTWVVQHHLVANCPQKWKHPLQVLTMFAENQKNITQDTTFINSTTEDLTSLVTECHCQGQSHITTALPVTLPLRCRSHHLHKWRPAEGIADSDVDTDICCFYGGVKVICSDGIVYRMSGDHVLAMEIYPGDGSVLVSKGCDADYFTHFIVKNKVVEERTYCTSVPPPEGTNSSSTSYSVKHLIKRGQRLLHCSVQALLNLSSNKDPICWQNQVDIVRPAPSVIMAEEQVTDIGSFVAYSSGHVRIRFTDRTSLDVNYDIEKVRKQIKELGESWCIDPFLPATIRLFLPSGHYHYISTTDPQQYQRYINFSKAWITWVMSENRTEFFKEMINSNNYAISVNRELQKIKCFNYLLDNLSLSTSSGNTETAHGKPSNEAPSLLPEITPAVVVEALRRTGQAIRDIDSHM